MTKDQMRIAIAEICGWSRTSSASGLVEAWQRGAEYTTKLPDYPNDLNAMHKAEKKLDDGALWHGYLNRLWEEVCPEREQMGGLNAAIGLLLCHATASQKAKAFLKTLNKWTSND